MNIIGDPIESNKDSLAPSGPELVDTTSRDHGRHITKGSVALRFRRSPSGRTILQRQFASYPFHICRALYFDSAPPGIATVYLQSSAGGVYQHDRLSVDIAVTAGASAHVTTQASTVVHGMPEGHAVQDVRVEVEAGGFCEYLPDPTILFPDADLESRLQVRLHDSGTAVVAESFLMHDPAGEARAFRRFKPEVRIVRPCGTELVVDRLCIAGDEFAEGLPGFVGPFGAQGTVIVATNKVAAADLATALREAGTHVDHTYGAASVLPNGCGAWARLLCRDAHALRCAMTAIWSAARTTLFGVLPEPRRK